MKNHPIPKRGFTLLEMLVVIGLLSIMAATAFVAIGQRSDQEQFDLTKKRYETIRQGIFSNDALMTNSQATVSGYIADVGALPETLVFLYDRKGGTATTDDDIPAWGRLGEDEDGDNAPDTVFLNKTSGTFDKTSQEKGIYLFSGWRNVYFPRLDDAQDFLRDGWGNRWNGTTGSDPIDLLDDNDEFILFSTGKDRVTDNPASLPTNPFEQDFPSLEQQVVTSDTYQLTPDTFALPAITIDNMDPAKTIYVGLIYPGLFLNDSTESQIGDLANGTEVHESLLLAEGSTAPLAIPTGKRLIVGEDNYRNPDDPDEEPSAPTIIAPPFPVFFNKPLAYRYQIAIYRAPVNIGATQAEDTTLAQNLIAVYPTVFHLLPGRNNGQPIVSDIPWKIPAQP